MDRRESIWKAIPWPLIVFLLGLCVSGLVWGGGINQRVAAAEDQAVNIEAHLIRIEAKIDWLMEYLIGAMP